MGLSNVETSLAIVAALKHNTSLNSFSLDFCVIRAVIHIFGVNEVCLAKTEVLKHNGVLQYRELTIYPCQVQGMLESA